MLTQIDVQSIFTYDKDTGNLIWKVYRNSNAQIGQVAGHLYKTRILEN